MTNGDSESAYTTVIIGDSFVQGIGAEEGYGWAQRLRDSLGELYDVRIEGRGGESVRGILEQMDEDLIEQDPDLVFLQVGINDSRQRESFERDNEVPPSTFDAGLREFIERTRDGCRPHTQIVVIGTTPVDEELTSPHRLDRWYTRSESRKYNDIVRDVCREKHVRFLDVFDEFEARGVERLLDDGLHPNDEGHRLIYDAVSEELRLDSADDSPRETLERKAPLVDLEGMTEKIVTEVVDSRLRQRAESLWILGSFADPEKEIDAGETPSDLDLFLTVPEWDLPIADSEIPVLASQVSTPDVLGSRFEGTEWDGVGGPGSEWNCSAEDAWERLPEDVQQTFLNGTEWLFFASESDRIINRPRSYHLHVGSRAQLEHHLPGRCVWGEHRPEK